MLVLVHIMESVGESIDVATLCAWVHGHGRWLGGVEAYGFRWQDDERGMHMRDVIHMQLHACGEGLELVEAAMKAALMAGQGWNRSQLTVVECWVDGRHM